MKTFNCEALSSKPDFSGYEREQWVIRTQKLHQQQMSMLTNRRSASDFQTHETKYGVRYSELLRLPYFDIVEYNVNAQYFTGNS